MITGAAGPGRVSALSDPIAIACQPELDAIQNTTALPKPLSE